MNAGDFLLCTRSLILGVRQRIAAAIMQDLHNVSRFEAILRNEM
jgi:hypothetical protein